MTMEHETNTIYLFAFHSQSPSNKCSQKYSINRTIKKKILKHLTSLHFQCDTFFQNTLNYFCHLLTKEEIKEN